MTGNVHAEYMFITDIKSVWMQKITGGKKKKKITHMVLFSRKLHYLQILMRTSKEIPK